MAKAKKKPRGKNAARDDRKESWAKVLHEQAVKVSKAKPKDLPDAIGAANTIEMLARGAGYRHPRPEGNPPALTPVVENILVRCAEIGMPIAEASACAGIHQSTLRNWLELGVSQWERGEETDYARLTRDCAAGRALFMARHLENMEKHARKNWLPSAWLLERRDPANFGQRKEVTIKAAPTLLSHEQQNKIRALYGMTPIIEAEAVEP